MKTSSDLNYSMPAEWEEHKAVWLAWPNDEDSFPNRVCNVDKFFAKMIAALQPSEQVELLVLDQEMRTRAMQMIEAEGLDSEEINFHITKYADVWLRDTGPIFVKDSSGKIVITNWIFNSWGNKWPELLIDGEIPEKISEWKNLPSNDCNLVLEGGAIEVNGEGVCLTTEQCLLNENRNPGITKKEIEGFFQKYLGIKKTIWLKEGLTNDHTDGHIDELARFVSPNKIVCGYEDNKDDENYKILSDNYNKLSEETDINGDSFEIIKLPMPHFYYDNGTKAPASYTNFYIGNNVVLVPIFQDNNDELALGIIGDCFPERKIIGIDCSDIIYGGGAVHCVTQQQPK